MKNSRTAPVLLGSLFTLIISLCPGLPQAAKAAEPMTVEGTWVVTWAPPETIDRLRQGQRVTIRRKGPGEYGVLYCDGQTVTYYGSPTEINESSPFTFEDLKIGAPHVPDAVAVEVAAAGVRTRSYYKLSPDGSTLVRTGDIFEFSQQSGHLIRDSIVIKPPGEPTAILTRVPETTAPTKTAERKPSEETPPGPATEETKSPEQPAPPKKPVAKHRPAQPAGGAPRPPELPPGGALSGN